MMAAVSFDVRRIREDFPILREQAYGRTLVYLDNAATSQKPQAVLDALMRYYTTENANVHRGVHLLSERATEAYEQARRTVEAFLGAASWQEIVFTRGTTESINLVAQTWGRANVRSGDEILITGLEHHSNIVPWQLLAEETGARLRVAPLNAAGEVELEEYEKLLSPRTRIVAFAHVSNALGTINPVRRMAELAHAAGAVVLVDGAQAAPHLRVNVRELDCDFYALSGHKLFGPTGIGVLYGRRSLLESMPPWQGGGDMIRSVSFEKTTYNDLPYKFEAGTPHIAGVVGLAAAMDYVNGIGLDSIAAYEHGLLEYATERLNGIGGVRLIGTAREKAAVLSFTIGGVHPHDVATVLDRQGIAVRAGHHCAQPVMQRYGVPATTRASLAFYNTRDEIDALARGIETVQEVFR
jgi:cysteine desulfurase/selenocysteine lyase